MNEILTVKETADFLRTTCQQVRKMIMNGELPAVKVGREWRIPRAVIKEFFNQELWK
ncbi:helix-turn-helix domain-containing protein [Butyricicoccus sp. Marseille-Q5471]|uniref:helix-turn-helix domain-containing protein n=1 Tax=Butyricicoccus sp. Marseille-Q5471 TaxID=3039493 RepID=UPI0024BD1E96|nr:helix-turn-helix domain-containing protein [Butyricicoccus sp. Marseille-Q5471]